jgi:hypothetical protein
MDDKATAIKDEVAQLIKSRADIDRQIERRQLSLLRILPESMGYESIDALIGALMPLASASLREVNETRSSVAVHRVKRRKQYDGSVRARVRHSIETLRQTAASISRAEGVSIPTIMKWKREWGLTGATYATVDAANGATPAAAGVVPAPSRGRPQ